MIQVIFSSKASKINVESIKFFTSAIPTTAKLKIFFEFIVAKPKDAEKCKSQGVTSFPTLIHGPNKITGLSEIKKYINILVNKVRTKADNKTEEDVLKEYWKSTIGGLKINQDGKFEIPDDDEDEDENEKVQNEMKDKVQKEMLRRKLTDVDQKHKPVQSKGPSQPVVLNKPTSAPRPNMPRQPTSRARKDNLAGNKNPNTIDVLSTLKGGGQEASDDVLMAKMFANMEETMV